MAVVLDRAIDALAIDGTRHQAILVLIRRVPAQEGLRLVREAHFGERRARERAVADPGAAVAARSGLDARALAVHQDPGDRCAQALFERGGEGGSVIGTRRGAPANARASRRAAPRPSAPPRRARAPPAAPRSPRTAAPRSTAPRSPRGRPNRRRARLREADRIVDLRGLRQASARERREAFGGRRRTEAVGRRHRGDRAFRVDAHAPRRVREASDARDGADQVQALPARGDLERAHDEQQANASRDRAGVRDLIARDERGADPLRRSQTL